jgi:hypothetical protein
MKFFTDYSHWYLGINILFGTLYSNILNSYIFLELMTKFHTHEVTHSSIFFKYILDFSILDMRVSKNLLSFLR